MQSNTRTYVIQATLFIVTIITTTMAGAEWMYGSFFSFVFDIVNLLAKPGQEIPASVKRLGLGAVYAGISLFHTHLSQY